MVWIVAGVGVWVALMAWALMLLKLAQRADRLAERNLRANAPESQSSAVEGSEVVRTADTEA